eukprot:SAG31_NODE_5_length_43735_cov_42.922266_21_plen_101_part_00
MSVIEQLQHHRFRFDSSTVWMVMLPSGGEARVQLAAFRSSVVPSDGDAYRGTDVSYAAAMARRCIAHRTHGRRRPAAAAESGPRAPRARAPAERAILKIS